MLRVSSLGLRCYRHTLRSATSKQCLVAATNFGCQLRHVASKSSPKMEGTGDDPEADGGDASAAREVPPHLKGSEAAAGKGEDLFMTARRLSGVNWESADMDMDAFPPPMPDFPRGNFYRRPVHSLKTQDENTIDELSSFEAQPAGERTERSLSDVFAAGSQAATHGLQDLPLEKADDRRHHERAALLDVLATTRSPAAGWEAYHALMSLPQDGRLQVPWQHLHRLARLISQADRTRTLFLRLLSVISTIHKTGGSVHLWEWNTLLDFAGKGFRCTRDDAYKDSRDMYEDLIANKPPGTTFMRNRGRLAYNEDGETLPQALAPDVYSLTTLLNIAVQSRNQPTIDSVWELFRTLRIQPNRITFLVMIAYHTDKDDPGAVRRTIKGMRDRGFVLGLDGLNQCIWAFNKMGQTSTSEAIYNVLRHNFTQDPNVDIHRVRRYLAGQHIVIPPDILPDSITYMTMLQPYTYNGSYQAALQVFQHMVMQFAGDENYNMLKATLPAYRAFFLGFYRWGAIPPHHLRRKGPYRYSAWHSTSTDCDWTLDALEIMFNTYVNLEGNFKPTDRQVYWILMAYARITGNDLHILRGVYERIETRFQGHWTARIRQLKTLLEKVETPDENSDRVDE